MNILFIHRSFMGQFKYLATVLSLDPKNTVMFLTEDDEYQVQGIKKIVYTSKTKPSNNKYLNNYESALERAISAAKKAEEIKSQGFKPDVIYGFAGWGSSMLIKDVFPDVPFICYCEWFVNPTGANIEFDGTVLNLEEKAALRCNNAHVLTTLSLADAAISPTQWQKNQFPKEFHDKISVIHDGVDTGLFMPDENVKFIVKSKMENGVGQALHDSKQANPPALPETLEFTTNDEIITYGTRGFEPTRGFPQFMEAVEKLLKSRPNAHVLIAGDNKVHYGSQKNVDYKALMLKKLDLDMNRVHFVGTLPYAEYKKFLQVSSVHIYLTYPFVLSWSILDAMATGCCLVASKTEPVLEVIEDNYNGLLTDFFNVEQLVEKIEYALDNKNKIQEIRKNARQSVIEKYDLTKVLPQQIQAILKARCINL